MGAMVYIRVAVVHYGEGSVLFMVEVLPYRRRAQVFV